MVKQLLTASLLVCSAISGVAQKPDTAQLMVHYKFSWVRDTAERNTPYKENMALMLGKNSSAYRSYDGILEDAKFKKQVQEQLANSPDGNVRLHRDKRASGQQFYQFPGRQKLVRKEQLFMNSYRIDEAMPIIAWVISSDTESFGGMHCQKATAHFKGRDYTAWFCADLPFHAGPWKLNGLPGVILEAYDATKEVVFDYDGIEKVNDQEARSTSQSGNDPKPDDPGKLMMTGSPGGDTGGDPFIIQPPTGAIPTSEKDFARLEEAMKKDPNAFVQSQMAASGMNQGNGPKMKMDVKAGGGPVMNNPIELPEKK
jgi:GLPGLI family protein